MRLYCERAIPVYSEDVKMNLAVNRLQKNVWSWSLIAGSLFNTGAYLWVTYFMDEKMWIGSEVYIVYIILESVPIFIFMSGVFYIKKKRNRILQNNETLHYVDDDIYWKNGWYSNPNDKRLIVQDWACSFNYTTNMARPAGKISFAAGIVITIVCLLWVCVLMFRIDFTPIKVSVGSDKIEITSGYSDMEIDIDEVQSAELLPKLPNDEYKRVNGSDDGQKKSGNSEERRLENAECIFM